MFIVEVGATVPPPIDFSTEFHERFFGEAEKTNISGVGAIWAPPNRDRVKKYI